MSIKSSPRGHRPRPLAVRAAATIVERLEQRVLLTASVSFSTYEAYASPPHPRFFDTDYGVWIAAAPAGPGTIYATLTGATSPTETVTLKTYGGGGEIAGVTYAGSAVTLSQSNPYAGITVTPLARHWLHPFGIVTIQPDGNTNGVTINGIPDVAIVAGDLFYFRPRESVSDCSCGGGSSHDPVRYADGIPEIESTDLSSDAFGHFGITRSYALTSLDSGFGNSWSVGSLPYLVQDDAGNIAVMDSGTSQRWFDVNGSTYTPKYTTHDTLTKQDGKFVLTAADGSQTKFLDFADSNGLHVDVVGHAKFDTMTDAAGNVTAATYDTDLGTLSEVLRTNATTSAQESWLFEYTTDRDVSMPHVNKVTLRNRPNSSSGWTTVRKAEYTYYTGTTGEHGNLGDLRSVKVEDAAGNPIDQKSYRYWTQAEVDASAPGFVSALKYVFEAQSYARADASLPAGTTVLTADDEDIKDYADNYFEYDSSGRVTLETAPGSVDSTFNGGLGTTKFVYANNSSYPSGGTTSRNYWQQKTIEYLPDDTPTIWTDNDWNTVYTNNLTQPMLSISHENATGTEWKTYREYDADGRLLMTAQPSAVTGYAESYNDLVGKSGSAAPGSSSYYYLTDSSGLMEINEYYTSVTAPSSGLIGYLHEQFIRRNDQSTPIKQRTLTYATQSYTPSGLPTLTVHPIASDTVYRNDNATGGQTTSYGYTFTTNSVAIKTAEVTKPIATTAQNGSGVADVAKTFYDAIGRPIRVNHENNSIDYTAYDAVTGAVIKQITNVKYNSLTTAEKALFTDTLWTQAAGLHLITLTEVDELGRPRKVTDPIGNITYLRYNDAAHEMRVYRGWQQVPNTSTYTTTGPVEVTREDRAGSYTESLSFALGAIGTSTPSGTEAISDIKSLSRDYTNASGQVITSDRYFDLSGVTYSAAANLGAENTNYYRTRFEYDHNGNVARVQSPTGAITRIVTDAMGREISTWIGTDDTPTSGAWSPGNTAGTNLVIISENVYDNGGVGDSNLTKVTQYPDGSSTSSNRVSRMFYDWRDRLVVVKSGEQDHSTESSTAGLDTNRLISYVDLNNLGETTATYLYEGDDVYYDGANANVGSTNGVPDKPSASLLRGKTVNSFDEQGRVYLTQVYSVDSSGNVGSNTLDSNSWYNSRGFVIKALAPSGLVTKYAYDGAGRQTFQYVTDGGGDTSFTHAGNVTSDNVLEQVQTRYDAAGNVIATITKRRHHDETATGGLGLPGNAPRNRTRYVYSYYDAANRPTSYIVDLGNNNNISPDPRPADEPEESTPTLLVQSYDYDLSGRILTDSDPRDIKTRFLYDLLGRKTSVVEAYTDGVITNSTNRTTTFSYDGMDHVLTMSALLPDGPDSGTDPDPQTTQYVYGVAISGGSDVNSNDLLAEVRYPDKTTGAAGGSASDRQTFIYNALGQAKGMTDQNGTSHTYTFDVLGRQTKDVATLAASNPQAVDNAILRLQTAYDSAGRAFKFSSFASATSNTPVNEVQRDFNGFGQLTVEYQSHSGAVDTTPSTGSLRVRYAYSNDAKSRLVSMTYPNGRILHYEYNTGVDSSISRLSFLADDTSGSAGTHLEEYSYLGLSTIVKRAHTQPGVDLSYIKQSGESNGAAGDQYAGLDRFDRVVDQRWIKTSNTTSTDRFKYGYDENGNVMYKDNTLSSSNSELYHANGATAGYDNLNRLTAFQRGALNTAKDSISGTVGRSQSWNLDALGNWDGASGVTTDGAPQSRTHNRRNQSTAIGGATLTFDNNGNTTKDENGITYIYDAWNRLVKESITGYASQDRHGYDALGRRITTGNSANTIPDLYYSSQWQVLEERSGSTVKDQYVWSIAYVDAMVLRDRDAATGGDLGKSGSGLDERLYAQQDANFNVTALVDTSGAVVERFIYDPYGAVTVLDASWAMKNDGAVADSDFNWVYLHQGGRFDDAGFGGLYSFGHRYYSPTLGRWMQQDPISYADGLNLYQGLQSSPIRNVDPLGTWPSPSNLIYGTAAQALADLNAEVKSWRLQGWNFAANLLQHFINNTGTPYIGTPAESALIKADSGYREAVRAAMIQELWKVGRKKVSGTYPVSGAFENRFYTGDLFRAIGTGHFTYSGSITIDCKNNTWSATLDITQRDLYYFRRFSIGNLVQSYYSGSVLQHVYGWKPFVHLDRFSDTLTGEKVGRGFR